MDYSKFIEPKTIDINGRTFVVSKIPAIDALRIHNDVCKAISDSGLIGMTMLPFDVEKSILNYTALDSDGVKICPNTDQLINDVFKGKIQDLKELVIAMVRENFDFLMTGTLLEKLVAQEGAMGSDS